MLSQTSGDYGSAGDADDSKREMLSQINKGNKKKKASDNKVAPEKLPAEDAKSKKSTSTNKSKNEEEKVS